MSPWSKEATRKLDSAVAVAGKKQDSLSSRRTAGSLNQPITWETQAEKVSLKLIPGCLPASGAATV